MAEEDAFTGWARGYGAIRHSGPTRARIRDLERRLAGDSPAARTTWPSPQVPRDQP
jgi:hypothetical protein